MMMVLTGIDDNDDDDECNANMGWSIVSGVKYAGTHVLDCLKLLLSSY